MIYDGGYLFPPRPEKKVPQGMLQFYENRGWWAQKKKNGTCTVIFVDGSDVTFKTRHPDDNDGNHKLWTPLPEHIKTFQTRKGSRHVYVAELLHSKVSGGPKNQLFIFDYIVEHNMQLIDATFKERMSILGNRWKIRGDEGDQLRVNEYVSIAHCYTSGFAELYDDLKPEDEGLVLKNPEARLKPCFKGDSNSSWQAKCRIPHKNYSF